MVIAVAVALVVDAAQRIRVLMGVHLLQELPLRYEFARVLESSPHYFALHNQRERARTIVLPARVIC